MGTDGMVIDSGLVLYGQRFAIPEPNTVFQQAASFPHLTLMVVPNLLVGR